VNFILSWFIYNLDPGSSTHFNIKRDFVSSVWFWPINMTGLTIIWRSCKGSTVPCWAIILKDIFCFLVIQKSENAFISILHIFLMLNLTPIHIRSTISWFLQCKAVIVSHKIWWVNIEGWPYTSISIGVLGISIRKCSSAVNKSSSSCSPCFQGLVLAASLIDRSWVNWGWGYSSNHGQKCWKFHPYI